MSHSITQKNINDVSFKTPEPAPCNTIKQECPIGAETVTRTSIDYDKVGLIDQVVTFPIEIQKGKYQSPTTRQSILNDDLKWKEFEYQKEISFNYFSKQTPFNYDAFYEDIISLV